MKIYISGKDSLSFEILDYISSISPGEHIEHICNNKLSFSDFLKKDMQKYKQYSEVIIEYKAIKESDNDFVKLLEQFQLLYSSRIIILISDANQEIIKSILSIGINNIAIGTDYETITSELDECLSPTGVNSIKWVRMFPDEDIETVDNKKPFKALILLLLLFLVVILIILFLLLNKPEKEKSDIPATTTTSSIYSEATVPNTTTPTATETPSVTVLTTTPKVTTITSKTSQNAPQTVVTTTTKKPSTPKVTTATTTTKKPTTVTTTTPKKTTVTTAKATTTTKKPTVTTTTTKKATTTTTTTTKATTTTTVYIRLTGLALAEKGSEELLLGESITLTPVYTPSRATNKKVYWESNRPDRVIVDSNGKCTAVGVGAAVIICTSDDGGLTAAYMIIGVDG